MSAVFTSFLEKKLYNSFLFIEIHYVGQNCLFVLLFNTEKDY